MQPQPKKLWRKIGLQKNFLQGTSHSDSSKNTIFQQSFIRSQQQHLQNSSFLNNNNQLNHQQIGVYQFQLARNQLMQSEQRCQTPIQKLMTDSSINNRYALWEKDQVNIEQSRQNKQNKHLRYKSEQMHQGRDKNHTNNLIQFQSGSNDTVELSKDRFIEKLTDQKQILTTQEVNIMPYFQPKRAGTSAFKNINQKQEITYESYPMFGQKEKQMIKIRLLGLGNEYNVQKIDKDHGVKGEIQNQEENKGDMNKVEGVGGQIKSNTELQTEDKQNSKLRISQKLAKIRNYIILELKVQSRELRQQNQSLRQQLIMALNQIKMYITNTIEHQFQQHLNQLNDQIAYLYAQNQELMNKIEQNQLFTKKLTQQNTILSQSQQNKSHQIKNTQQTITNLQNHINSLQQKLQDFQEMQIDKQSLLHKLKSLEKQIALNEQNQTLLNEKIKTISLECSNKQIKIQQLQWEITQLQSKQLKMKELQMEIKQLRSKQLRMQKLQMEITELKDQNKVIQINLRQQLSQIMKKKDRQFSQSYHKLNSQLLKTIDQAQIQRKEYEKQRKYFQKQKSEFKRLKKELQKVNQERREFLEMGQLLETLLSQSLRHNTIEVLNNIQKEYKIKQYDTLYTMFAFVKQEIYHHNSNKSQHVTQISTLSLSHQLDRNNLHKQIPLNQTETLKNQAQTLNNQQPTLNNQSSKSLLRKTGCFGQLQPNKPTLKLTLHDLQKNYSTEIPEQVQLKSYQNKNKNILPTQLALNQFNTSFGQSNQNQTINTKIDANKFKFVGQNRQQQSDKINYLDNKSQQVSSDRLNLFTKNKDFPQILNKVKYYSQIVNKDKSHSQNLNKDCLKSVFFCNKIPYQPYQQKQQQSLLPQNLSKNNHNRHQSRQLPYSKVSLNPNLHYNPTHLLNSQITENLKIIKSAFHSSVSSQDNQFNDINDQGSTDLNKRHYKVNKRDDEQKMNEYVISNQNYSFSQHNSNQNHNFKRQEPIFDDQYFLNDELQDTQSVISTCNANTNRNYATTDRHSILNNKRFINDIDNNRKIIEESSRGTNRPNFDYKIQMQKTIHKKEDNNQHILQNQNDKNQRQDMIQKIKQRVKQNLRISSSKHQPSYQNQFTPKQPSYHLNSLTPRSTYQHNDYFQKTKPSILSTRKDEMASSQKTNNILADFYQKHRKITVPSTALKLNQRNRSPLNHSVDRSPSNHSVARSPTNNRQRSPSNCSSVTGKMSNKYSSGIKYTSGVSNNKIVTVGLTSRSGFSKSLIQKPQFVAHSRKIDQIPRNNTGATYHTGRVTYQSQGLSSPILSQQVTNNSYNKKY